MRDVTPVPQVRRYEGTCIEVSVTTVFDPVGRVEEESLDVVVTAVLPSTKGRHVTIQTDPETFDQIVHDLVAVNDRVQADARRFARVAMAEAGRST